ncbi:MAG: ATP synthase F0 subunit B [Bacteroidetes bacterium]|nr:MAG: ATP synthase F0 subunit B [Bacteroidota bacterium]
MELITPSLGLLFWTAIIFVVLMLILSKFAWKPIVSALEEREKFIADSLSQANQAKEEMAKLKSENEALLAQARSERDKMLKDAQTVVTNTIAEAKDKAGIEAEKMIANARVQILNEKNAAITELKNLVATTSVEIAEQIVKKNLSNDAAQKELIEAYLKESKFN